MRARQDAAGLVQASQQRRRAPGPPAPRQALAGGDLAGPLDEVLDSEQLTLNGPRDELLPGVGAAGAETLEDLAGAERSDGADLRWERAQWMAQYMPGRGRRGGRETRNCGVRGPL
ncbi:MAG: hypothetical protein ACAI18_19730 [Gemmatimonadales bacterium]